MTLFFSGCVLLVVPGSAVEDYSSSHMHTWRKTFTGRDSKMPAKGYIDASKQQGFVNALTLLSSPQVECADGMFSWKVHYYVVVVLCGDGAL